MNSLLLSRLPRCWKKGELYNWKRSMQNIWLVTYSTISSISSFNNSTLLFLPRYRKIYIANSSLSSTFALLMLLYLFNNFSTTSDDRCNYLDDAIMLFLSYLIGLKDFRIANFFYSSIKGNKLWLVLLLCSESIFMSSLRLRRNEIFEEDSLIKKSFSN